MTSFCLGNAGIFFGLTYGLQIHRNVQIVIFQLAMGTRDVALWFLLLLLLRLDEKPALVRWLWRLACLQLVLANLDGVVCWVVTSGAAGWLVAAQRLDDFLTIGYTSLEVLPLAIVVYALFRGRRLDPARWLVAAFAFLLEMISITYTAALQGREYTHSKLAERLDAPLFTVFGSAINAQTLAGTLLLLSLIYALYRNSQEVQQRQMAVERELMSAREMQRVLVPEVDLVTPGYVLTSSYKPASEVGGDFFVVLALEDEATLIVLGDVSGKGLKAAMAVSLIVGMVRALGAIFPAPGRLLAEINDRLAGRLQGGFATAIAVRLEPRGDCTMASAGHLSPFVNEREVELPGALPLGIVAGVAYEERRMELMEGDHLAIYTDGLLEARNARGELYGFERLHALFGSRPNAGEVSDVAVSFGQDDDITVLTLTRVAVGDSAAAVHTAPMLSPA
jgi:serine phosphatase RsbU (regulator of sigma subunit)